MRSGRSEHPMRFRSYKARTSQTTKQISTMVPTSPYPNIAASSKLKIVGFRNPISYFAPLGPRCLCRSAHNPNNPLAGNITKLAEPDKLILTLTTSDS